MSNQQRHDAIRAALASLGYHVRSEKGYALYIAPQAIAQVA